MKIKTTAHVYYEKYTWDKEPRYIVFSCKMEDTDSRTYIGEQQIEVEVPDNYDPRPAQIAALEKQKKKVMADFQKTVDQINERISKLQAIEYTA